MDVAVEALAFLLGLATSFGMVYLFVRHFDVPVQPTQNPNYIFRFVHREDREAYVRIQRRTLAIQMRDFNRATNVLGRQIGKALIPALRKFSDEVLAVRDEMKGKK